MWATATLEAWDDELQHLLYRPAHLLGHLSRGRVILACTAEGEETLGYEGVNV